MSEQMSGAGLMRNRCARTARDMAADWPEAFTYAIVLGWDSDEPQDIAEDPDYPGGAMREMAEAWGWDDEMVAFLRDTHERFKALADRTPPPAPTEDVGGAGVGADERLRQSIARLEGRDGVGSDG